MTTPTTNDPTTRALRLLTTPGGMQLTYTNGQPCRLLDDVLTTINDDSHSGRVLGVTDDGLLLVFVDVRRSEGNGLPVRPAGGPGLPRGVQRWQPDNCAKLTGSAQQQLIHDVRGSNWQKAFENAQQQATKVRGGAPVRDTSGIAADDDASRQPESMATEYAAERGHELLTPPARQSDDDVAADSKLNPLHRTQTTGVSHARAVAFSAVLRETVSEDADTVARALTVYYMERRAKAGSEVVRLSKLVGQQDGAGFVAQLAREVEGLAELVRREEYHRGVASGKLAGYGWTMEPSDLAVVALKALQAVKK